MQVIRRNTLKLAVASLFCAAPLVLTTPAHAEGSDGYLTDGAGQPVRSASGVGESQPAASCRGVHGKRLVACLQPDRHAELTAVGNEIHVSEASR